ncbi:heme-binding protein [Cocleimonas sp. KMM 6892]|uniref:GlcG/HbpS family heme-binding protein n=1 Tax=unclassified Cocleimonas TaxID=2639732 RepID=UPI002DB631B7|nr:MULTISPECIES: heme-binding protein [unclassified Cocleimonas]MEB8432848.1 heme-binding protein [Cocleimonas sp. KMM 6892]MEC4715707.1 heme-binding protein [Cocleimonas sp. KMM 6895]MEC4744675.1 heme-binding protein [Cocleimonas sp. KMM 6896]
MLSITRLDIDDAHLLIKGARNKANEIGVPMCIAITDESGNLIAFERMNGGKTHSISIAQDKAFTAGAARKATHDYNAANVPGSLAFGIDTECGGRISSVGGGIPVVVNEEFVGGIGASSGTPQQDMEVAQAGIDYFLTNL